MQESSAPNRSTSGLSATQIEQHVEQYSENLFNQEDFGDDDEQGERDRYSVTSEPNWGRAKRTLSFTRKAKDGAFITKRNSKSEKTVKRSKQEGPDSSTNGKKSTSDQDGPAGLPSKGDDHTTRRQPMSDGGGGPSPPPSPDGSDPEGSSNQGSDYTSRSRTRKKKNTWMGERSEDTIFLSLIHI